MLRNRLDIPHHWREDLYCRLSVLAASLAQTLSPCSFPTGDGSPAASIAPKDYVAEISLRR